MTSVFRRLYWRHPECKFENLGRVCLGLRFILHWFIQFLLLLTFLVSLHFAFLLHLRLLLFCNLLLCLPFHHVSFFVDPNHSHHSTYVTSTCVVRYFSLCAPRPTVLNQARKFVRPMPGISSNIWATMIRVSRLTILLKFRSQAPLKKPRNLSLSLSLKQGHDGYKVDCGA